MFAVRIKTTAREAARLSGVVSPSRSFTATGKRGVYEIETDDEVLAIRDAAFLTDLGVEVLDITTKGV